MPEGNPMLIPNSKHVKRILWKGLQGEDVKYVQEIMIELNNYYKFCPYKKDYKATGYFGDDTATLIKFFQYKHDLIPDCHFDKATSDAMENQYYKYIEAIAGQHELYKKAFEKYVLDQF